MKQLGKLILWQRAADYLKKYQPTVIGIAGSTGKTITKNAIAIALQNSHRVRSTPFSYNTRIGVALSILGINRSIIRNNWLRLLTNSKIKELSAVEPDTIVLELGADRPGDIDYFARNIPFNLGVITNIQSTHLRLFTSKDYIAHEMKSLIVKIPENGSIVLNADDPLALAMQDQSKARLITFGEANTATVQLLRFQRLGTYGFACEINIAGKFHELHLPNIVAPHHIPHILAALAVAQAIHVNIPKAIEQLQSIKPPPGRMRLLKGYNNAKLLDDSYSASPEGMLAALNLLSELPSKRKIAILGDMLDLGTETLNMHREIGISSADIADVLVTVGTNMRHAGAAALNRGDVDVHHFDKSQDVGKWLHDFLLEDDLVLIKGSRDIHMEKVTRRLLANPAKDSSKIIQ